MIDEKTENEARQQQEFNSEWVVIMIVSSSEFQVHQIEGSKGWSNEDKLHESVINTNECCEEVQVSTQINDCE